MDGINNETLNKIKAAEQHMMNKLSEYKRDQLPGGGSIGHQQKSKKKYYTTSLQTMIFV